MIGFLKYMFFFLLPRPKAGEEYQSIFTSIIYRGEKSTFLDVVVVWRSGDFPGHTYGPEVRSRQSFQAFTTRIK